MRIGISQEDGSSRSGRCVFSSIDTFSWREVFGMGRLASLSDISCITACFDCFVFVGLEPLQSAQTIAVLWDVG